MRNCISKYNFCALFIILPFFIQQAIAFERQTGYTNTASSAPTINQLLLKPHEASFSGRQEIKTPSPLAGTRLQRCQILAKNILTRSNSTITKLSSYSGTLTAVFTGVQNYYSSQLVLHEKTVPTYATLITTAHTAQMTVTANIQAAKTDLAAFTCTGNEPSQKIVQFQTDMKKAITAINEYKIAIKNLIIAVRTVTGTTSLIPTRTVPTN